MGQSLATAARSFAPYQWWHVWYDTANVYLAREGVLMWVYREQWHDGDQVPHWAVGFFDPAGEWHTDSVCYEKEKAAARCRWLNGGG